MCNIRLQPEQWFYLFYSTHASLLVFILLHNFLLYIIKFIYFILLYFIRYNLTPLFYYKLLLPCIILFLS